MKLYLRIRSVVYTLIAIEQKAFILLRSLALAFVARTFQLLEKDNSKGNLTAHPLRKSLLNLRVAFELFQSELVSVYCRLANMIPWINNISILRSAMSFERPFLSEQTNCDRN